MKKKVLVIDDSALMRRVLSDIINADSSLVVADSSCNGLEALKLLLAGNKYDVILADINMPKMDGVEFLKEMNRFQMKTPVLIVSSIASKSGGETIQALEYGALDFLRKPDNLQGKEIESFKKQLLQLMYLACGLTIKEQEESKGVKKTFALKKLLRTSGKKNSRIRLVFIACSTGGPKALQSVVPNFPADFPHPIVIVQHMPIGFTASLASRLNEMSPMNVKEIEHGEPLEAGTIYIAQGGKQCEIKEQADGTFILLETDKPARKGLRPCADIFLESVLETSLDNMVCGVLTGMGRDACEGIQMVKQCKKMKVVAQSGDTCIVYGMPRAVVEAGVVDEVVPLEKVASAMIKQLGV